MSTDVAALGLSVDSSEVEGATSALEALSNAAAKAEGAASSFSAAAKAMADAVANASPATNAATQAMDGNATSAENAAAAAERLAASQAALHKQFGEIGEQIRGIGLSLASGDSPFVIALEQGSQLGATLGEVEGGVAGMGRALVGAFTSMLNPVTLVTQAVIIGGGYLLQYFTSAKEEAEKADAALKQHLNEIEQIAAKWGEQIPAVKEYYQSVKEAEDRQELQHGKRLIEDSYWKKATDELNQLNPVLLDAESRLENLGARTQLPKVIQQVSDLQAKIAAHTATPQDVADLTKSLSDTNQKYGIKPISDAIDTLKLLQQEITTTNDKMRSLNEQFNKASSTIGVKTSSSSAIDVQTRIQDLTTSKVGPLHDSSLTTAPLATGNAADGVNKLAQAYAKLIQAQQKSAEDLALEAQLMGASDAERNRATAALQAEQQLREQHINTLSQEGQAYIANAKAIADAKTEIDRQNAAFQSLQQTEGDMIDTLTSGLTTAGSSWKDTFRSMAQEALSFFNQLAIANPLKNALTGTNLPTLGDFFSKPTVPNIPGATTTGNMTVTAAVVNVNGGVPGLPGASPGGLAGLIGYNPAATKATAPASATTPGLGATATVNLANAAANQNVPATDVASYIQQAAIARGIDPNTALAVARSEGGLTSWNLQSRAIDPKTGLPEESYGPYQLYMNGGLGNQFQAQTGLNPALAQNGPAGIDFALDYAAKNGWSAWHGAANTGISDWQGIGPNAHAIGTTGQVPQAVNTSLTKLASTSSSAATNLTSLGDQSKNLTTTFSDFINKPASPANNNYFPPAPQGQNYFPPAPSGGFSLSGLLGGIPIIGPLFSGLFHLFGFSSGGYTGNGGKYEPAGIVHRGEYVVNANATKHFMPMLEAMNNGYAAGGLVQSPKQPSIPAAQQSSSGRQNVSVGVGVTVDKTGNLRAYVKSVSIDTVDERVPGHIANFSNNNLPGRVKQISEDQYANG